MLIEVNSLSANTAIQANGNNRAIADHKDHSSENEAFRPRQIVGDIPVDLNPKNGESFLFVSKSQVTLTHGIHKFPAKFFPELPRWIISKYSREGDWLLDPFTGSGTTNLEASTRGRHSIGIDVDPFARLITEVKTTVLNDVPLRRAWKSLSKRVESYSDTAKIEGIPDFPYRDNWLKSYILKELAFIKNEIEATQTSEQIKRFFLVCFSSIIRHVSEADNNCTRTVVRKSLGKKIWPRMAIDRFLKRTDLQVERMCELNALNPSGRVIVPTEADARNLSQIEDERIDLALTSPPYVNAVDYPRTHQLEIYWLGIERGSLREMKQQHVGTEVVRAAEYSRLHSSRCKEADEVIQKIFDLDPRRAYIATKYLLEMSTNLREVHRVLKPRGRYVIVVGNNRIRNHDFETWKYLCSIATDLGFEIELCFVSAVINHFIKVPRKERINNDFVVVLQK